MEYEEKGHRPIPPDRITRAELDQIRGYEEAEHYMDMEGEGYPEGEQPEGEYAEGEYMEGGMPTQFIHKLLYTLLWNFVIYKSTYYKRFLILD